MCNTYHILNSNQDYIDKTDALEKGITAFPSIYIEGAAACGKTTAVKMLLLNHPETAYTVFDMKRYPSEKTLFCQELAQCLEKMSFKSQWVIFENLHTYHSEVLTEVMVDFVWQLPANSRAIVVSREKPPEAFLELLWKQQMMLCKQQILLFNRNEVDWFIQQKECALNAEEVYAKSGGWAGCAGMLVSLSMIDERAGIIQKPVDEYMRSYEMRAFIRKEIIGALEPREKDVIRKAGLCPWIDQRLCNEVWKMQDSSEIMTSLMRKGLLLHDTKSDRWQSAPMIRFCSMEEISGIGLINYGEDNPENMQTPDFWKNLGFWYEKNGYIQEALYCLKKTQDQHIYRNCIIMHFLQIPFSGIDFCEIMRWQDDIPEVCYLRGMYSYMNQDFAGLECEIRKVEKLYNENPTGQDGILRDVYMNLRFVSPEQTLDEWLALLENSGENRKRLHLYHVLGNSPTALCGLRDLSGLFACSLKEERRKEKIWKKYLDEDAWKFYQLARMDYYMETLRSEAISREDRDMLLDTAACDESWQMNLARYYVLCKYQKMNPEASNEMRIRKWKDILTVQQNDICENLIEAVDGLYTAQQNENNTLKRWEKCAGNELSGDIGEVNFSVLCFRTKRYILAKQYNKVKKALHLLIRYAKEYRRNRYLTDLLFQNSIVHMASGNKGQTLRSVIESFLVCGGSRYVSFYTDYGKKGLEVIQLYAEWMRGNAPEGWSHKKKYNYGNVIRMPEQDYLAVILRRTHRAIRTDLKIERDPAEERLTMMETMVLQDIGRGLTNAEICESLNLKMTTVKSHVYSVYKKLGVNGRVQAVLKGKELGIIQ